MDDLNKVIEFLQTKKRVNLKNCELNGDVPTPYMEGSHRTVDETIDYIKALQRETQVESEPVKNGSITKRYATFTIKGKEYKGAFLIRYNEIIQRDESAGIEISEKDLSEEDMKFFCAWFKEVLSPFSMNPFKSKDFKYVVPYVLYGSKGTLHGCFIYEHILGECFKLQYDFLGSAEYKT